MTTIRSDLPDLFRGSQAVTEGLLTARQLRGGYVRQVLRDVYRPAWVPLTVAMQCRAAILISPPSALVTGLSLATWRGVPLAEPGHDVEMIVPVADHFGPVKGVRVRAVSRMSTTRTTVGGEPVADSLRMGFDLAARRPLEMSVAYLDAAAHAGMLDLPRLRRWLENRHDNDVEHVRLAASLADARAESVPESRCRVRLTLAGIAVEPQFVVTDRTGGYIERADLAIPELKIAISYDGRWHEAGEQKEKDRRRWTKYRRAGWEIVHVTASTLRRHAQLEIEVRAAMSEQLARQPVRHFRGNAPSSGRA